jgi:small subunit ribosomal protein S4
MGDPRRTRGKYQGPRHPWNKERIDEEKLLVRTYGLVNKKELWKVSSKVKAYKESIKKLLAQRGAQADKEQEQLFSRLKKYGLLGADASVDDVLSLRVEQLLDRRLQTILLKHELAHTTKQARQFITHGHIILAGKKITSPGHLVTLVEESTIEFRQSSQLVRPDHPERVKPQMPMGAHSKGEVVVKGSDHAVKTDDPEAPVIKTKELAEEKKPLEAQIEDETTDAKEVAQAVEEIEANTIAKDKEEEVNT